MLKLVDHSYFIRIIRFYGKKLTLCNLRFSENAWLLIEDGKPCITEHSTALFPHINRSVFHSRRFLRYRDNTIFVKRERKCDFWKLDHRENIYGEFVQLNLYNCQAIGYLKNDGEMDYAKQGERWTSMREHGVNFKQWSSCMTLYFLDIILHKRATLWTPLCARVSS